MGGSYDEELKLSDFNAVQPVNASEPIVDAKEVSDEVLKLTDANAVQPLNALGPMDVRSVKSKLVKPVQPSNEPLPIDVTFEKSKLSKAVQLRKAVSLIKNAVCGRDSVLRLVQPSKQE